MIINPENTEGYYSLTYEYELPREGAMLRRAVRHLEDGDREYFVRLSQEGTRAEIFIKPVAPMEVP